MIVSDKYKCIYIGIPKTGSSSICAFFRKIDPQSIISTPDPPYGHYTCSEIKSMIGEQKYNEYFKFTFFRNPLDWFKSNYADHMSFTHKDHKTIHILLDHNYQLENVNTLENVHVMNCFCLLHNYFIHKSQKHFIDDHMDFVGDFSRFDEHMLYICKHLQIQEDRLPHVNKSRSEDLVYSTDAKELVRILLKNDILYYEELCMSN